MAQLNTPRDNPKSASTPQNIEAEASLLGSLLIDSEAIVKIADNLSAEDFYDKRHQYIYDAIMQLYNDHSAIDVLTLSDRLANNGQLELIGGSSYLTELTNFVPTAAHVEQYADIVAQKALRRRLIKTSQEIAELGQDESKQLRELIEEAEIRLFNVSNQHLRQNIISLEAILADSFERLDELHKDKQKIRGVSTGFKDLDDTLAGFQRSDLIVLAARPSMGKTAMALNFAHNIASQVKLPVLIFSLEMSKEQLVDRLLSMESGVDAWSLRTGNLTDSDFEKLGRAMGNLSEAPIFIDDTPSITVSDLRTKARREAHKQELGLIIVDYLQLMSGQTRFGNEGNRVQEISEISRGLKGIARELNVPLLALSQLSRSVETRSPQIPQLADLRESGCLAGSSLIFLPALDKYVAIKDIANHPQATMVYSLNYHNQLQPAVISNAFKTGIKPVFRLKTKSGKQIKATANHKFLSQDGWVRLDKLCLGQFIAVAQKGSHLVNDSQLHNLSYKDYDTSTKTSDLFGENYQTKLATNTAKTVAFWDEIVAIEPAGREAVYDLTVPFLHNFLANDIIVHNSIEQDADVVAFIYREDYYNPETDRRKLTDVLIKKHRNGPTGGVELYFDSNRQLFRSVDTKHSDPKE